ncbi:MAG: hypothetical protein M5U01_28025 [Ardenticatenaceae bacterium]|nr:hypothetical protein [Ardenticatenaceae bacterium]
MSATVTGRQGRAGGGDVQVIGSKVVAPLGDTVRLIHRQQADSDLSQSLLESDAAQPFRRHVGQAERPGRQGAQAAGPLGNRESAVDSGGRDAAAGQTIHLVLHQRNQRRDDQGQAGETKRGNLIDERLPGPGGHDCQRVPAGQHAFDGLNLPGPESRKAEVGVEGGGEGLGHGAGLSRYEPAPGPESSWPCNRRVLR